MSESHPPMRQRILEAAFNAFMRHGYSGASTAQIARVAQVSKRDMYALFGSKQAMLAGCVTARAERMRLPLGLPIPEDLEGLRRILITFGMTLLRELSQPEVLAVYRLAISESDNAPEVARMLDRHGRQETNEALLGLLTAARERGLLRGEPSDMLTLFQGMLLGGGFLIRLLMRVAAPPAEADTRERAEAAVRGLLRAHGGIGSGDGG